MNRFQYIDEHGRLHFHYERWKSHRRGLFEDYPVPAGKVRVELELWHPRNDIESLPFTWNPHLDMVEPGREGVDYLPAWFPFYSDPDWSTVFDVQELRSPFGTHLRMFVEHGHVQPWGENIRLSSTSSEFEDGHANRTAYFRGLHWVTVVPVFHYTPTNMNLIDEVLGHADTMSLVSRFNQNEHLRRQEDMVRLLVDEMLESGAFLADADDTVTVVGNNRTWRDSAPRPRKASQYKLDWAKNGF